MRIGREVEVGRGGSRRWWEVVGVWWKEEECGSFAIRAGSVAWRDPESAGEGPHFSRLALERRKSGEDVSFLSSVMSWLTSICRHGLSSLGLCVLTFPLIARERSRTGS